MNKKQQLAELVNIHNNGKRKSRSDGILLFIAQLTAETNTDMKWLIRLAGIACAVGLGVLVRMAIG